MEKLRVVVSFKLKEKDIAFASVKLRKFVLEARKQSGCLDFEFVKSEDTPNLFFFLELWEDPDSNHQHIRSENFRTFAPFFATHFETLKVNRSHSLLNETAA